MICVLILLVLSLTELGRTCKEHGLSSILNEDECKKAIKSLGSNYGGSQKDPLFPKGCYADVRKGIVQQGYLNTDATDSGHQQAKAICKGNQPFSNLYEWTFQPLSLYQARDFLVSIFWKEVIGVQLLVFLSVSSWCPPTCAPCLEMLLCTFSDLKPCV